MLHVIALTCLVSVLPHACGQASNGNRCKADVPSSLMQTTLHPAKVVLEVKRDQEGEGLLQKSDDATVVATRSAATARDLYSNHASRLAQLQHAKEEATRILQVTKEIEKNLLAQQPVSTLEQPPNLTAQHENKSAHYQKMNADANASVCRACGTAEKELIDATQAASTAHTAAQTAAAFLGESSSKYAAALQGFNAAKDDYTTAAGQMCPITLDYDAAEASFVSQETAATNLKQKALIAQQHKTWETGNKTIVDTAQSQYDTAAGVATAAEQPIAAKEAAAAAACAPIKMVPATPAPTQPPTPVPTLGSGSHPCCLPNSVVRVLYPAGTLPAPASSIRLLIARQTPYAVSYKGIAIGEQDGDGGKMKTGTIASFNKGETVGPVTSDTWTQELSYNLEAGKNYLISFFVVVGPDGWVEWPDQGKKIFIKDWDNANNVVAPDWNWQRIVTDKMYNIKAVEAK